MYSSYTNIWSFVNNYINIHDLLRISVIDICDYSKLTQNNL